MQKVWYRSSVGSWYATFSTATGQKQRKLFKGPNDRDHKKLAEQKLLEELKCDPSPLNKSKSAPDWLTVRGVLKGFLKFSKKKHEPSTYVWYKNFFKSFARFYGNLRVNMLTKKHVFRWLEKAGYNPTSANRAIGAIKAAFNWAASEEYISRNPIVHVKKPRGLVRDRVLTSDERQLIFSSIRDEAFRRFVLAMSLTGARPGEVASVTRAQVDLEQGLWVFAKHKTYKQTGKPRIVYLCPEALELSKELAEKYPEGPIFLNTRGKPWTRNAIRIRFRNIRKKFPQLKGVIAYTFRSSYATDALEAGVPDAAVSTLLGHVGGTATLHKFYARLSHKVDYLKEAAVKAIQVHPEGHDDQPDKSE